MALPIEFKFDESAGKLALPAVFDELLQRLRGETP